jgi:hypothetical protein
MATVTEIKCPSCEKALKVPESVLGKKVKCKACEEVFVAERPGGAKPAKKAAVSASKPGGPKPKKEEPRPEPKAEEKPAEPSTYQFDEDEGEGGAAPKPLGVVDGGEDVARCPHCAKELDPPDAKVCIHCGFNNMTRVKAESKKTWAPTTEDWVQHLGPGILALIICVALIVLNVVCFLNMRDWLTGSFLESEDPDPTDPSRKKMLVKPGAFITFILAATIMPIIGTARFAIKRLFINYMPEEKVKT